MDHSLHKRKINCTALVFTGRILAQNSRNKSSFCALLAMALQRGSNSTIAWMLSHVIGRSLETTSRNICMNSVFTYKTPAHCDAQGTMWMKTIQQDLKSNNLALNEAMWLRIVHTGECCLRLALPTSSCACQKRGRRRKRRFYHKCSTHPLN